MPYNPKNNIQHEQWDVCQRCGFVYPMSKLTMQKGLRLCVESCFDNIENDKRDRIIAQILASEQNTEGADMRWVDYAFEDVHGDLA